MEIYRAESFFTLKNYPTTRGISDFVFKITNFDTDVYLSIDEREVNAKSMLGVLSLSLYAGCNVHIKIVSTQSVEQADMDLQEALDIISENFGVY